MTTEGTINLDAENPKVKLLSEIMQLPGTEGQKRLEEELAKDPELTTIALRLTEHLVNPNAPKLEFAATQVTEGSQSQLSGNPPSVNPQGEQNVAGADSNTEIDVKINPEWLGTYGKNRDIKEALKEMRRGIEEKDKYINFLKNEKLPILERELQAAQSRLSSTRQSSGGAGSPSSQGKEIDATSDNDDDYNLPENFDLFDPAHSEKLLSNFKKVAQEIKEIKSGRVSVNVQAGTSPEDIEYAHANALTRNPSYAGFFNGLSRDVKSIEGDYLKFVQDLAIANNYNGSIVDNTGRYTKEVADMVSLYDDVSNANGDKLRTLAAERGIKPPDDMNHLITIYNVRKLRNTYAKNGEPLPWEEAMSFYVAQNPGIQPQQPAPQSNPALESHQRTQRALYNRAQFSKEPPANAGADLTDINKIPMAEFNRLQMKDRRKYTPQEKETWNRILRDVGKFSEDEIQHYYE